MSNALTQAVLLPKNTSGERILLAFLDSYEVRGQELASIVSGITSLDKPEQAKAIADALHDGSVSDRDVIHQILKRTRPYIAAYRTPKFDLPQLNSPTELLWKYGENETWYGPEFVDGKAYYIWNFVEEYARNKAFMLRWLLIAEIRDGVVFFSWRGISRSDEESDFPYWQFVRNAKQSFEDLITVTLNEVRAYNLVMTKLWNKYIDHSELKWRHIRIRAERHEVKLNASGRKPVVSITGDEEEDMKGLELFAEQLADTAIMVTKSKDKRELLIKAILNKLIRRWGPIAYEFTLTPKKLPVGERKFHHQIAICTYFGQAENYNSADSLEHFKFSVSNTAVVDFLATEINS